MTIKGYVQNREKASNNRKLSTAAQNRLSAWVLTQKSLKVAAVKAGSTETTFMRALDGQPMMTKIADKLEKFVEGLT